MPNWLLSMYQWYIPASLERNCSHFLETLCRQGSTELIIMSTMRSTPKTVCSPSFLAGGHNKSCLKEADILNIFFFHFYGREDFCEFSCTLSHFGTKVCSKSKKFCFWGASSSYTTLMRRETKNIFNRSTSLASPLRLKNRHTHKIKYSRDSLSRHRFIRLFVISTYFARFRIHSFLFL